MKRSLVVRSIKERKNIEITSRWNQIRISRNVKEIRKKNEETSARFKPR